MIKRSAENRRVMSFESQKYMAQKVGLTPYEENKKISSQSHSIICL